MTFQIILIKLDPKLEALAERALSLLENSAQKQIDEKAATIRENAALLKDAVATHQPPKET